MRVHVSSNREKEGLRAVPAERTPVCQMKQECGWSVEWQEKERTSKRKRERKIEKESESFFATRVGEERAVSCEPGACLASASRTRIFNLTPSPATLTLKWEANTQELCALL